MKKLWIKIQTFFVTVFGSEQKVEQFLLEHADEAIQVFGEINKVVHSPVINAIELVLPAKFATATEAIRQKVESVIEQVITELKVGDACLQLPTFPEKFACFVAEIRKLSPKMQNGAILKGASSYVQLIADQPIKESMADTAIQHVLFANKIDLAETV